ncbi:hypothetical protein ABZW11_20005 [Nonomuraea sp. NPDC004580]|uniref:hypothetical protein n=1 Tax=Nonomuraea sp. NPDC004580 TaxID=3154552 RepID=UPI0033A04A4A
MRTRVKAALAMASTAAALFTHAPAAGATPVTAAPAAPAAPAAGPATAALGVLDVNRGKTRCFSYSFGDDGTTSVTVYFHNRCKHSRGIKIRVAQAKDACIWVRGGDYDKKKFKGPHPTVQSIREVSHCG